MNAKILTNETETEYATLDCPQCGTHGTIDRDQYEGKVSILCDCGFHQTIDFRRR